MIAEVVIIIMTFGESWKGFYNKDLMRLIRSEGQEESLGEGGQKHMCLGGGIRDLLFAQGHFSCRASPSKNTQELTGSRMALPDKKQELTLVRYPGTVNLASGPQVSQTEEKEKQIILTT